MKKTYKTTFEAEQFDGSKEMAKEYEMLLPPAGEYYVTTVDGFRPVREGDWLISNGEDIAIVNDDYFEEHYELVEDDELTDLAKVIKKYQGEECQAEESRMLNLISQLVMEVGCMDNKLGQIQDELRQQEKIRHNEKVAQSSFVDELTEALKNLL